MILQRTLAYLLVLVGSVLVWAGCSYSNGSHTVTLFHLPPSESVSTRTVTVIGAEIQPATAAVRVGYVRSVENATPIVEGPAFVPDVEVTTTFSPDGTIQEGYSVGKLE